MADNNADRDQKGRQVFLTGSQHHQAKLTEAQIPVIRALSRDGVSQRAIAKRFGVCSVTIREILIGKTWRHVP